MNCARFGELAEQLLHYDLREALKSGRTDQRKIVSDAPAM
jgi:hypothetical protein